jgi:hypothetical protein
MTHQESSTRTRAIRGAVRAWRAGQPHRARTILVDAGYGDMWPEFQRAALRQARARFLAGMAGR